MRGLSARGRVFATAGGVAFLTAADNTVVAAAAPSIGGDLGLGLAATQAITAAYLVPFAGLLLSAGAFVDRVGERRALRLGLFGFAAGTVLAALGARFGVGVLLGGRAAQGAAAALLVPAALGVIRTRLSDHDRPKGAALWAVCLAAALAGGPALGGLTAEHLHWTWVFWGFLPIVALGVAVLPEPAPPPRPGRVGVLGGGLAAAAMALLTGGLLVLADGHAVAGPLVALGLAAAAAFAVRERHAPILPRELLASRTVRVTVVAQALWGLGVTGVSVVTPLVHQRWLGLGPAEAALPLAAVAGALILAAPFVPRLSRAHGQAAVAAGGLAVVAAGLVAIAAVDHIPLLWPRMPGLVLIGIGSAATVPLTTLALDAAGERAAGAVSGLLGAAREFAGALGVALIALVVAAADLVSGYTWALAAAAAGQLAAAALVWTLCPLDKPSRNSAHQADKSTAAQSTA
ncbi:MFS transporter [Actinokineospora fastidiosa]|uniref:MFS transporter n=1 Tax=Actinokineospora fastidiosa TaxID=1816 RepID=A0A918GTR5_9PSEU|nr:MFS transporter [Actinokineospora fastidiosa]GGS60913.1 MFS transporter [Actinokineospora fastidiosa]